MQHIKWTTGYGVETISPILSKFRDNGRWFAVIPCGRSHYDVAPPYAVIAIGIGDGCGRLIPGPLVSVV